MKRAHSGLWLLLSSTLAVVGCGPGEAPKDAKQADASKAKAGSDDATKAPAKSAADEAPAERAADEAPAKAPGEAATAESPSPEQAGSGETSLAATLEAQAKASAEKRPPEATAIMEAANQQLAASDILAKAIKVGDTAPDFSLPDATGETVTLSKLLESGPVVVLWYRGGWCPYCNTTLKGYAAAAEQIRAAGGTLVAISPEKPDNSLDTQQKLELAYTVLSDSGNAVAREYNIVFELPAELANMYEQAFSLHAHNGDESNSLPLAATYVIDRNGKVTWAFLDTDYKKRAEPSEVVAELRKLGSSGGAPG